MPTYYTGDPSDMSRYQATAAAAASMGYYPTTSDPSGVGGVMSRDHTSFGVHPEAAKFGGVRGTTDVTSPVSSNHSQQQQQQQQQQGVFRLFPYIFNTTHDLIQRKKKNFFENLFQHKTILILACIHVHVHTCTRIVMITSDVSLIVT